MLKNYVHKHVQNPNDAKLIILHARPQARMGLMSMG